MNVYLKGIIGLLLVGVKVTYSIGCSPTSFSASGIYYTNENLMFIFLCYLAVTKISEIDKIIISTIVSCNSISLYFNLISIFNVEQFDTFNKGGILGWIMIVSMVAYLLLGDTWKTNLHR